VAASCFVFGGRCVADPTDLGMLTIPPVAGFSADFASVAFESLVFFGCSLPPVAPESLVFSAFGCSLPPAAGCSLAFSAFGCSLPPAAGCSLVFFAFGCSSRPVADFLLPPAAGFSEDNELSDQEKLYIPFPRGLGGFGCWVLCFECALFVCFEVFVWVQGVRTMISTNNCC
jgi:hypothetical protein